MVGAHLENYTNLATPDCSRHPSHNHFGWTERQVKEHTEKIYILPYKIIKLKRSSQENEFHGSKCLNSPR